VTDDGVVGYGDGTLNGRELAVASYLRDHVAPLLVGRDPHPIEDTWQFLYRGAYWRHSHRHAARDRRGVHHVFGRTYRFDAGYLHPGEEPGIGVTLNEEAAAAYPYALAYLPVNALRDGTVHDW
jgi:L-alanine-DL-glutamate epimerase-like enolase superfamily enzyme